MPETRKTQTCTLARQATHLLSMAPENLSGFQRLFIAIAVPPAIRDEIGRAQGRLKRNSPPGIVRWTRPEQFHVTLKFLGDVPIGQIDKLQTVLAPICAASPALQLLVRGIGFFPNERKPKVIWVGVHDETSHLSDLHRQIDEALRWLTPPERAGNFSGHITLGRFKPGHNASIPKLLEETAHCQGRQFGEWQAGEAELVRSELMPGGAKHTPVSSFAFSARQ